MNRKAKYFLIDSALVGLLAVSGLSGLSLWLFIPRRTALCRLIKDVHLWSGMGLAGLASYHFIQHLDWYVKTGRSLMAGRSGR